MEEKINSGLYNSVVKRELTDSFEPERESGFPRAGSESEVHWKYLNHAANDGSSSPISDFMTEQCHQHKMNEDDAVKTEIIGRILQSRECRLCGQTFLQPFDLHRHIVTDHTDDQQFAFNRSMLRDYDVTFACSPEGKLYRCFYCDRKFVESDSLVRHIESHNDDKIYHCDYCNESFADVDGLLAHVGCHGNAEDVCRVPRNVSNDRLLSATGYCSTGDRFDATGREIERDNDDGENLYRCYCCSKAFVVCDELVSHMQMHINKSELRCQICNREYLHVSGLMRHMKSHACGRRRKTCNREEAVQRPTVGEMDMLFRCKECNQRFNDITELSQHMLQHSQGMLASELSDRLMADVKELNSVDDSSGSNSSDDQEQPSRASNSDLAAVAVENPSRYTADEPINGRQTTSGHRVVGGDIRKSFNCDTCDKTFTRAGSLARHRRLHTNERPHKCQQCDMAFARSFHLVEHMRCHSGEKPYQCNVCGKDFARSGTLLIHTRTHNPGSRIGQFVCSYCDKSYSSNNSLLAHLRTHTGEKPYRCAFCGKEFAQSTTLSTHRRIHTGERPFRCQECNKCFTQSNALVKHMRSHTGDKPYRCLQCDKSYSASSALLEHTRTHTGEKPYSCDQCDKSFITSTSLTKHKLIHSGLKPHVCDVCGKGFRQLSHLRHHRSTQHGVYSSGKDDDTVDDDDGDVVVECKLEPVDPCYPECTEEDAKIL